LLFKVINIGRTCSIYLASLALQDDASRQGGCARNARRHFKFEKQLAYLVTMPYCLLSCTIMSGATAHTAQDFHASSQDMVPMQTHCSLCRHHLACFVADLGVPNYIFWDNAESKVYRTCPANTGDLRQQIQECIQGILKYILCYSALSIMIAGVY